MIKKQIPHGARKDRPVCGPTAVAAATGIPFAEVMAKFASTRAHQWRGRTGWLDLEAYIVECTPYRFIQEDKLVEEYGRKPLGRYVNDFLKPSGVYIIRVGGHFVCAHGGWVIDQYDAAPVGVHWAGKKQVLDVARVDGHKSARGGYDISFQPPGAYQQMEFFSQSA